MATEPATTGEKVIHCLIVTPERTVLDERVDFLALPLYDGELGVLPDRAPLVARLGFGELRTHRLGHVQRYFIDGGFVQLRDNVVTILTSRAQPASGIDPAVVNAELDRVRARTTRTEAEYTETAKDLARGRAQLRVAERAS